MISTVIIVCAYSYLLIGLYAYVKAVNIHKCESRLQESRIKNLLLHYQEYWNAMLPQINLYLSLPYENYLRSLLMVYVQD